MSYQLGDNVISLTSYTNSTESLCFDYRVINKLNLTDQQTSDDVVTKLNTDYKGFN